MLKYAPDPIVVGGNTAVPITIDSVVATVVCNCVGSTATAVATMVFTVGPDSGRPIFDLRQTLTSARLDGVSIPTSDLAHQNLNGDNDARMRIVAQTLSAGSTHTLELEYEIEQPASPAAIPLNWGSSPRRLTWDFWFTDLQPGRYLEMWFPANLVYDEHTLSLDLRLNGAQTPHTLVSNATITNLGSHHWQLDWPSTMSSFDPLLYLTPSSNLVSQVSTLIMPSGTPLTLELNKLTSVTTPMPSLQASLETWLTDFEADIGGYIHDNRFVALVWDNPSRAMEYAGGTTSNLGALKHEVFHSWFARGVKPARQADSWMDEAWTKWLADGGGVQSQAFDFTDPPTELRFSDPWRRDTPSTAYTQGRDVFAGLADELGIANLKLYMREIYAAYAGRGVSTEEMAAHIIRRSSRVDLLDYFHHFVYGATIPTSGPDLYLRDAASDSGTTPFGGQFWRSPDIWIRNNDDGGTTHQNPEFGQDNWFYARVRNRNAVPSRLFGVTFTVKTFAGTQFVYPGDWAPYFGVAVADGVAGNATKIVKARWPAASVPSAGTHGCLLAHVYTPDDPATLSARVWEDNNLAQRNMTIVDLIPGDSAFIPVRLGSRAIRQAQTHRLELVRPKHAQAIQVVLTHPRRKILEQLVNSKHIREQLSSAKRPSNRVALEFLEPAHIMLDPARGDDLGIKLARGSTFGRIDRIEALQRVGEPNKTIHSLSGNAAVRFSRGELVSLPINLSAGRPVHLPVMVSAPATARLGEHFDLDLIERDASGKIVGGIGIRIRIVSKKD